MSEEKLNSLTREEAIYYLDNQMDYTYQLQQENQQLKEVLDELNQDKVYWINKCANAESVLDEIREYIDNFPCIHYASVEKVDGKRLSGKLIPVDELLQILDKVKEGSNNEL